MVRVRSRKEREVRVNRSMSDEGWSQVRSLFGAILELCPAERDSALEDLGRSDPQAAAEVRRLLSNLEAAKDFLEQPVAPWRETLSAQAGHYLKAGDVLAGRYEIRRLLGAGGMGEVYEAWDREMRLAVALKLLSPQLAERSDMVER